MLSNVLSLSHRIHSRSIPAMEGEGKKKGNPSWLVVFRPKDLWPQLHVATPRCSWWDVINSIKDCENPLNTLSLLLLCWLTVWKSDEFPAIIEAACEKPNAVSAAYHFHLSCSGDSVTHALRCVRTPTHRHTPERSASLFYCSYQAGYKPQCNAAAWSSSCRRLFFFLPLWKIYPNPAEHFAYWWTPAFGKFELNSFCAFQPVWVWHRSIMAP